MTTRWLTCLWLLSVALFTATACAQGSRALELIDLNALDRAQFDFSYNPSTAQMLSSAGRKRQLSELSSDDRIAGPHGSPVDTVSIERSLLYRAAPVPEIPVNTLDQLTRSLGEPGTALGPVDGPRISHLTLEIANRLFVLRVLEIVDDYDHPARHVTAAVINYPPEIGIARFSVGFESQDIVGTIRANSKVYRVVPSGELGTQLVYELSLDDSEISGGIGSIDRYTFARGPAAGTSIAQRLEKRHIQAEVLADLQPSVYKQVGLLAPNVVLTGEDLGKFSPLRRRLDLQRLGDASQIMQMLASLKPLTGVSGDEELSLAKTATPLETGTDEYRVYYSQLFQGIRLMGVLIGVTENGVLKHLDSTLVPPDSLPDTSARISNAEAAEIAARTLEERFGASGGFGLVQIHSETEVKFMISPDGGWQPIWQSAFDVTANSLSGGYYVRVGLLTGGTDVWSTGLF